MLIIAEMLKIRLQCLELDVQPLMVSLHVLWEHFLQTTAFSQEGTNYYKLFKYFPTNNNSPNINLREGTEQIIVFKNSGLNLSCALQYGRTH